MRKIGLLVYLFIGLLCEGQPVKYTAVDSILHSYKGKEMFSGVVLIAEKGKIKYEKAIGYREFAEHTSLETTDIFELASVSKQFTAMVIMMLKEKGLLQYDDLAEKYIDIPYNLLTHTSGLPDYQAVMDEHWDKSKVAGNENIIAYLNKYAPPKLAEPGTKYAYSNTGYVMLASIAEKASGRDFVEFVTTAIFRKLGMKHTAIRSLQEKAVIKNFATGHLYINEKTAFIRADSFPSSNYTIWLGNRKGPGRISSTAEDLLKWDQALYTDKLISQQTLEEAFTPMHLADGKISNYGFGWVIVENDPAGKIVWHNGDNPGYKTEIMRLIDQKKTLIVLSNNAPVSFEDIIKEIKNVITH
jgi:CubicO group peptidase (beta-lactamase class C family)